MSENIWFIEGSFGDDIHYQPMCYSEDHPEIGYLFFGKPVASFSTYKKARWAIQRDKDIINTKDDSMEFHARVRRCKLLT